MNIDEIIAEALEEEFEERVEQCCADTKKHRFSLAYRLWEYKTLKNFRNDRYDKRRTLSRARYVVAMTIIAASLLVGVTAYAAVAAIGRYSFDTKPDYSKMFIENHPSDKTTFEEYYGLPEEDGWELVNYDIGSYSTIQNYECGEKMVCFSQAIIDEGNMGNINTENAEFEAMSIYEENDGFLIDYGKDGCLLYWIYDGYIFSMSSNFDKYESIKLAYCIKNIDF
ncbi:MAG: DUF4367 domain-containing protein [Ruminococcaceae bacterium]|nr:DUF4367 domain-containing protein [Oscillospiraceae bacterium]